MAAGTNLSMLNPTPAFGSRCNYVSWQKFLSNEDEILFLEKIAKIVEDRLTELNVSRLDDHSAPYGHKSHC